MARKMKDSGIEWIGEIPEGWEVSKLKYLGRYVNGYPFKPDDWGDKGKPIIRIQDLTGSNDSPNYYDGDIDAKYHIKNGDILVSWAATLDAFIWNKGDGLLNQHIFKAIPQEEKITSYFFFWMIKEAMQNMNNDNKHGIFMQHVTLDVFNNFSVPLPPLSEQKWIATYLFQKISEADIMLDDTLSSITGYKKLKQTVITQAVTKTIYDDFGNPSKFRKLRSLCDVLSKGTTPKDIETQNDEFYCIRYLKSENIVSNQLNLNPTFFITAETNNSLERSKLNSGDILFVIAGASIGKVAITTTDFLPANTNQAVAFIRLSSSYQYATKYTWYFLQSDVVKQLIALSAVQSAQPNLSLEDLGAMRLPLPDQMGCLKITDYLDAKCAEIDRLIAKKEQLVKELESYKKSLIYEVVTGKREVQTHER